MGLGQVCCTPQQMHTIIESLVDNGYSGMDEGTKVCHVLKGIKSTELEAVVNAVWVQPKNYGKEFDVAVSYLSQMVTKRAMLCNQSILPRPEVIQENSLYREDSV